MICERLYFESDALTGHACVLACDAGNDGQWHIVLDQTLFHLCGGGQQADTGWIGQSRIVDTVTAENQIIHIATAPIAFGPAEVRVCARPRTLHARLHSAGHLIGNVGQELGLEPKQAQHKPGASSVSFTVARPGPGVPDAGAWQARLDQLLAQNLPRRQAVRGGFRTVGFGDLPVISCGGTHVSQSGEIGAVRITAIKVKKNIASVAYDVL